MDFKISLGFALNTLFESLTVQLVKKRLFADAARPIKYITPSSLLHRVEGVDMEWDGNR